MSRVVILPVVLALGLSIGAVAQSPEKPKDSQKTPQSDPVPRSDEAQNPPADTPFDPDGPVTHREWSSSTSDMVDLTPPANDVQLHPNSKEAVREAEDAAGLLEGDELGGIEELRPWDPHKAVKDLEVGDFYFKRGNYRAALDRYQEALYYKNNDAIATFKAAVCQEKLKDFDEARRSYSEYLEILPDGPSAAEARQALARLGGGVPGKPAKKSGAVSPDKPESE